MLGLWRTVIRLTVPCGQRQFCGGGCIRVSRRLAPLKLRTEVMALGRSFPTAHVENPGYDPDFFYGQPQDAALLLRHDLGEAHLGMPANASCHSCSQMFCGMFCQNVSVAGPEASVSAIGNIAHPCWMRPVFCVPCSWRFQSLWWPVHRLLHRGVCLQTVFDRVQHPIR